MADKPLSQFERRSQGTSVPSSRPSQPSAKRSHHVVLLLMGTMAVGSTAYMLMPRQCEPAEPGAIQSVSSPAECPSRGSSSSSHGSGGSSRSSYYSSDSSTTDSSSVKRGGFGSSAHAFSSHFSFGS
ncbi:hypothetical protein JQ628_33845 [Bradyrhizobium lablabi]|uniref:hypothetical protein n=1 Tax=Bradyrhizobium lablabi TaxID=722472 RepID=UPI001BA52228|nr:hypothetical protein [Bradyrhizobium lablabi]MBR1126546.1 hypothetical protein [Bradyrhizobium lablabi]